ncbi:MAG: outer membrane beta-barrel protein, partial [Bacteroidota bacterium]|nr:outer membrane beta-barrel protein [Bacteroidota bacterium]
PPAAWEAVSHALDRQQAALYKSKYIRLKRAALVLSLFCFLGGMYIAFDVWQGRRVTSEQKQPGATLSSSNETNKSLADKNGSNTNGGVIQNNNWQDKKEQKQKAVISSDTAFTENDLLSAQNAKATAVAKKKLPAFASALFFPKNESSKEVVVRDKKEVKQNVQGGEEDYNLGEHYPLQNSFLQPFSLKEENKAIGLLNLQQMLENRKPALLSTGAASTIKIKAKAAHGFSLSFFAAPNFSFEKIGYEDHHRNGQGGTGQERHREEDNNFSLSGGVLLNYRLNKNWSLQSGVSVTAFSTSIAPKTIYAITDNNGQIRYELNCSLGSAYLSPKNNSPLAVGDSSGTSAGTSQLVYINIPALVSYHINKGRFSLLPTAGAALNVLASGKIKTGLDDNKVTTSINGLKRTYLNGSVGFGVEYKLTPKLSLGIRPNAKFTLTPINKDMPVKSYQNYLSVEAGVRIKL